jgi:hypothetical protein
MDYRKIITIEPGKRGGKPCIRGMRITVYDRTVLPCLGYDAPGNPYPTLLGTNFPYDKFLPTKTDGDRAYVYCDAAKNQGITASSYGASASGDRNAFCSNC